MTSPKAVALRTPSPLNGERAGVRGGNVQNQPEVSTASAIGPASLALRSADVWPGFADQPISCRESIEYPSTGSSKSGGSQCSGILDTRRERHLWLGAPGIRADHRPIPGCNGPRRRKNPGSVRQLCAGGGTYTPKTGGRAKSPRVSSPPKWSCAAAFAPRNWGSSALGLTLARFGFKPAIAFSPLTLALSPLRGEGIGGGRRNRNATSHWCGVALTNFVFSA
jgi:hypothetical protein